MKLLPLDLGFALNVLGAVLIIGIAIPSLHLAADVNQPKLKTLTIPLSGSAECRAYGLFRGRADAPK